MIISGKNDFYINAQNALSFYCNISFDRVSGSNSLSINGESGNVDFYFNNGRVIDHNNRFVWTYRSGETVSISGDLYNNSLSYWINNVPIGISRVSPNYYTGASIAIDSGIIADSSLFIWGNIPDYKFLYSASIVSGQNLSVLFINNNANAKEFFSLISGGIKYDPNYNPYTNLSGVNNLVRTIISGGSSVSFSLVPTGGYVGQLRIPVSLYTDFGFINETFTFDYTTTPVYYIDFVNTYTGIFVGNTSNKSEYHSRYNLTLSNVGINENLFVNLYDSGNNGQVTGTYNSSGQFSGSLNSFIINSGVASGILSGNFITISDFQDQTIYSSGTTVSGIQNIYATGCISGILPAWGISLGNDSGYFPSYFTQNASGFLYGDFSGHVAANLWTLTGIASGNITGVKVLIYTGDAYNFNPIPINQQYTGSSVQYYGSDSINLRYINGVVQLTTATNEADGYYSVSGSGVLYSQPISGNLTGQGIWASGDSLNYYTFGVSPTLCITGNSGSMIVTTGIDSYFSGSSVSSNQRKYPVNYYGWPNISGFQGEIYSGASDSGNSYYFSGRVNPYTYINSGFYSIFIANSGAVVSGLTGVIYHDSFYKSWTGVINNNSGLISGTNSLYYSNYLPSGEGYKIIQLDFYKSISIRGQNVLTGSALYVISGANNNFLYSGLISYT